MWPAVTTLDGSTAVFRSVEEEDCLARALRMPAHGPEGRQEGLHCISKYLTSTLLIMGRYYNTTMCHYWDMSVK